MPAPPSLSEADEAFAEGFLDDVLLCLPILGYGMFEAASLAASRDSDEILYLSARGIEATGKDTAGGFVVLEKSMAAGNDRLTPSLIADYGLVKEQRDELVRQGVLDPCGTDLMLTLDYTFSSPSLAASLLLGRKANGRTSWKTKDGRTLKELQDAEVDG
jgi:hypothetical protein